MARGHSTLMTNGHGQGKKSGGDSRMQPQEGTCIALSDARTPLAWQRRNLNYQQQQQLQEQQSAYLGAINSQSDDVQQKPTYNVQRTPDNLHHQQKQQQTTIHQGQNTARGRRGSSTSSGTSASTSSSSGELASRLQHNRTATLPQYPGLNGLPIIGAGTWDGEPCPVHHMPGGLNAVMAPPPPMILPTMATLPRQSIAPFMPPPPDKGIYMLLPPMMRPRPLVLPAAEANNALPEPLPVRDPQSSNTNSVFPSKENTTNEKQSSECHGHTVVLWFIISIITVGVILAAVLRFVMG